MPIKPSEKKTPLLYDHVQTQAFLEVLIARSVDVRTAQKKYFANRNDFNLRESKRLEKALDEVLQNFQKAGFDYEGFLDKNAAKQGGIF